jgi:hypothetical protein
LGTPSDYRYGLVPLIIQNLGYRIQWTNVNRADLVIYGSFYDLNPPRLRWLPRSWRQKAGSVVDVIEKQLASRRIPPVTLFHTSENLRHDHIKADYSISHDLNVSSEKHIRIPYWMEMIDWSHEGLVGNQNPRYGQLLNLDRLQAPLGNQFLQREQRAVLMSSHLREPRASCLEALKKWMPVDGMGPYFNKEIKDHHSSPFQKKIVLEKYAYNLCPENGIYPGYVTEKIPEAFAAGCLPITFVDESVSVDFNPKAFINLAPMAQNNFEGLGEALNEKELQTYAEQPLIVNTPSILAFRQFIKNVLSSAL